MMTRDPEPARDDRRTFNRTAVTLAADIRFGGLDCTGFTADVSAVGAFVRATDEADPLLALLQPGDDVELRMGNAVNRSLAIPARVVRKQTSGIGLQFDKQEPRFESSQILTTLSHC